MNPYPRRTTHHPHHSFSFNGYLHTRPSNVVMYHPRTHQPLQSTDARQDLYKWSVDEDQVAILNSVDMYPPPPSSSFSIRTHQQHSNFVDEVVILENLDMNQSFRHGGLTKKVISKNLKLKRIDWCEEEGDEICVICQVGFEKTETVGILECKHRYHVECIKEWLFRKNVCPLCKAQAFVV
ncbi:hypothetical protein L2E82_25010 [Cichorium intybus]|uniref:Uncharacterized protein n=1 Tax=Cichorium intybus TaxID=13427 RepID=A0ACB9E3B6_CICIN|nr:hypothetical protein L2E82_25010 [Cichorium intybus]